MTNLSIGFESGEGYVSGGALAGQQSWIGLAYSTNLTFTNSGPAGNGVISAGLGGSAQAAYVGLTPLPASYGKFLELSQPLALDPVGSAQPVVNFSAKIKIVDSTDHNSGPWDKFYVEFYNQSDVRLFSIAFDNYFLQIRHELKSGSTNIVTLLSALSTNATEYDLSIAMNFASNRCNVALNGTPSPSTFPLATSGSVLNLGTLSMLWLLQYPGSPGDNYMVFDNLRVTSAALVPPRPQLTIVTPGGTNAAKLRLDGSDGFRFALDTSTNLTSWQGVSTNIITSGLANYTDNGATNKPSRHYRARWVP